MKRVVVTGIGFVSPIGNDIETLTNNLRNGKCGISEITLYDDPDLKVKFAGQCKDYDPKEYFNTKEMRRLDRVNQFGIIAARKAVEDSEIDFNQYEDDRVAVLVASGIGGLETIERESLKAFERNFTKISPMFIPMVIANMTSAHIAIEFDIHGTVSCPITACASSNTAILDGYRMIKDGYADVVVAGGAEASITRLGIGGFSSMRALNESETVDRASIPFDLERSGFVMGEGGAILILEDYDSAKKRNAKIYGEIAGGYSTCDASHITAPEPEGKYAAKAMEMAIKDAGLKASDIDYINAHGTSTPMNDKTETKAIKATLGEHVNKVSVSSTKSMTGHLLGASGAIEAIISLLAMKNSFVPPTINHRVSDPECDLDITANESKVKEIKVAMSNSLGFGGHNVSIIMKGVEDAL